MNNSIQVCTRAPAIQAQVLEHTPIYDLDAYLERQKKLKFVNLRKACIETFSFCFTVVFTFSFLFLGE
ncbi:MAG: hypothetical protein ACK4GA_02490 [Acinetobacter sp.]|uniref:hypothetical protein n=1 Tax=Acinetobacter sp. TaxID=472 RepID=UPI00391A8A17